MRLRSICLLRLTLARCAAAFHGNQMHIKGCHARPSRLIIWELSLALHRLLALLIAHGLWTAYGRSYEQQCASTSSRSKKIAPAACFAPCRCGPGASAQSQCSQRRRRVSVQCSCSLKRLHPATGVPHRCRCRCPYHTGSDADAGAQSCRFNVKTRFPD